MERTPKFTVGQLVKQKAYIDCFNQFHPETEPLTVSAVRLMKPYPLMGGVPPYYRITANDARGFPRCEAAERFFVAAA